MSRSSTRQEPDIASITVVLSLGTTPAALAKVEKTLAKLAAEDRRIEAKVRAALVSQELGWGFRVDSAMPGRENGVL